MITIKRIEPPQQLTESIKAQLTNEFKKDKKKSVWDKTYIRMTLLQMSQSKCCYCEELINNGCNEMHIDHFHNKDSYPDEVVDWNNLLPSCSYCNKSKSTHDTYKEPIVNPTSQNPKEFFYIKNYRYCSYDHNPSSIGKTTIDVLGLNDSEKKVKLRFLIGNELGEKIESLYESANELGNEILTNTRKRNRILKGCKNILVQCMRGSRFGATMATVLHEKEDYYALKNLLIKYKLWDDELEHLHTESLEICMIKQY